ncbi:MAG: hypothetical protein KC646_13800 [Candidatus Cloacimonetes bacterium]|nr:hypothetical protein [Candidatus Cloacimonadota bacterium]
MIFYWQIFEYWCHFAYVVPYNYYNEKFLLLKKKIYPMLNEDSIILTGNDSLKIYHEKTMKNFVDLCNFSKLRSDRHQNIWHVDFPIDKCNGEPALDCRKHRSSYRVSQEKWQAVFVNELFMLHNNACEL